MNARPAGPFGEVPACAPGEWMQIDSTPLDVLVRLDKGIAEKVELTAMIDLATRSLAAAVLRPTTKAADASALLARSITPEMMRPGWSEALRMSRSVLPHRRLMALDERLEPAAGRPVIVPDTIVCDHGKVFISNNFRASCRYLGISLQPTHKASPFEKGAIEKTLGSVATLFAQFVAGYTGRSADRRGRGLENGPLWSLPELQGLLDEWIVIWQNRPHDALRDPDSPKRAFTPNEKYATLLESCGYVPAPFSGEDYVELLPERWQAINSYGIRINHRTYDDAELTPVAPSALRSDGEEGAVGDPLRPLRRLPCLGTRPPQRASPVDHGVLETSAPCRRPVRRDGLGSRPRTGPGRDRGTDRRCRR